MRYFILVTITPKFATSVSNALKYVTRVLATAFTVTVKDGLLSRWTTRCGHAGPTTEGITFCEDLEIIFIEKYTPKACEQKIRTFGAFATENRKGFAGSSDSHVGEITFTGIGGVVLLAVVVLLRIKKY